MNQSDVKLAFDANRGIDINPKFGELVQADDPSSASFNTEDPSLRVIEQIAYWLDKRYLDAIIGFILPGVGDIATAMLGLATVKVAVAKRLPAFTIARMVINLGIDLAVGAVPIIGDIFDIFFKAHTANLILLKRQYVRRKSTFSDKLFVAIASLLFLCALAIPFILLFAIIDLLF